MNISNFIEWFITQFVNIASNLIVKLDQILIYNNVSLLDFIITITIIGAFVGVIITAASTRVVGNVGRSVGKKVGKSETKK